MKCVVCEEEIERGFFCETCSDQMPDGTLAALTWAARRARELTQQRERARHISPEDVARVGETLEGLRARAEGFRAGLEAAARWKESGGEVQDRMDAAAIRALKEET